MSIKQIRNGEVLKDRDIPINEQKQLYKSFLNFVEGLICGPSNSDKNMF